jgi:hypothetical protein
LGVVSFVRFAQDLGSGSVTMLTAGADPVFWLTDALNLALVFEI